MSNLRRTHVGAVTVFYFLTWTRVWHFYKLSQTTGCFDLKGSGARTFYENESHAYQIVEKRRNV